MKEKIPGNIERAYAAGRLVWKASGHYMVSLLQNPHFVEWMKGEDMIVDLKPISIDRTETIVIL